MSNILLVEPSFPYPNKSKNKANLIHKNFLPIGLLKFASYYKAKGHNVQLVRGIKSLEELEFRPNEILVTSLFTYWSEYVWNVIEHYRLLFPNAIIKLGGIYATLHSGKNAFIKRAKGFNIEVHKGLDANAEAYLPDYSILPNVEYHATHMMRGCIRKCSFCGTWKIEPNRINKTKKCIIEELQTVGKNKVIFYDNNILANPFIKEILMEFETLQICNKPVIFESQSGFDGRLLENDPSLATLIRNARFENIRIAWDNGLIDKDSIKRQIDILTKVGYKTKDISIFMIYNFDLNYEDMIKKIQFCRRQGVQIADCRYRPLNLDYDNYNPHSREKQTKKDYYIHQKAGWTDKKIKKFRKLVRIHNIWIRYAKDKGVEYDNKMEKWSAIHNVYKYFNLKKPPLIDKIEKSQYLKTKIKLLNKIRKYCKGTNINPSELEIHYSLADLKGYVGKIEAKKQAEVPSMDQ